MHVIIDISATDSGENIFADDDNYNEDVMMVRVILLLGCTGFRVLVNYDFDEIEGCQEFDACNYNADLTDPTDCNII